MPMTINAIFRVFFIPNRGLSICRYRGQTEKANLGFKKQFYVDIESSLMSIMPKNRNKSV